MIIFDEEKEKGKVELLLKQEEEELASTLSAKYGVPYLDLSAHPINIDAIRIIKEADARSADMAVFNITDKKIDVAVLSPTNEKTLQTIENLKARGFIPQMYMVTHASLNKVWERYKDLSYSAETTSGALDISNEDILDMMKKVETLDDVKKLIEGVLSMKRAYRISKILEIILAGGISLKASDIHIEPEEIVVRLRYRLDGVLTDILKFDKETFELLLSRVKLISNLKLNTKGKAQDGRFSIKLADEEIEIRTSLLPGPYDESVVLRILTPESISVPLEELGIHPKLLEVLKKEIAKPNGMILTTGPTGSGKTTTLYAFLRKIYTPDIKVITIENPIEYHITGIVQTQTDETGDYTFASGLRSALRQDPDVIMVGEMRDFETAKIGVEASLTGHLVLSTLHTNSAPETIVRLLDMGIDPLNFADALLAILAQRLVRTLCTRCRESYHPDRGEYDEIMMSYGEEQFLKLNIPYDDKFKLYRPKGCDACDKTGYRGRMGIHELIIATDGIKRLIQRRETVEVMRKLAMEEGMTTLLQDGIYKSIQGLTDFRQVRRVCIK